MDEEDNDPSFFQVVKLHTNLDRTTASEGTSLVQSF